MLSICHGTILNAAQVHQRCEEVPQQLAHGPSVLLYAIMDMIVDLYQPIVHHCADAIEEVETRLFQQLLDRTGSAALHAQAPGADTALYHPPFTRDLRDLYAFAI